MVSLVTDFYMFPYLHISTDLKLDLQLDLSDIAAELFLAVLHLTPEHITVVTMQLQQTDCPQGYCSFYSMQLSLYASEEAFSRAVHTSGPWPRATTWRWAAFAVLVIPAPGVNVNKSIAVLPSCSSS